MTLSGYEEKGLENFSRGRKKGNSLVEITIGGLLRGSGFKTMKFNIPRSLEADLLEYPASCAHVVPHARKSQFSRYRVIMG